VLSFRRSAALPTLPGELVGGVRSALVRRNATCGCLTRGQRGCLLQATRAAAMRSHWAVTGTSKCRKKRLGARMLERSVARRIATRLDHHGAGAPALWHGSCLLRGKGGGADKANTELTAMLHIRSGPSLKFAGLRVAGAKAVLRNDRRPHLSAADAVSSGSS
jgi:hypothetical protein